MEDDIIVSPMNYMGGKKKLIKRLKELFPKDINVFVDLFCGGATVGVNADANTIILNDNLEPLMDFYSLIKCPECSAEEFLHIIDKTIKEWGLTKDNEEAYYKFREQYNEKPENRNPLHLFILACFSFNNQIRFSINKGWKFNVPFGKREFNETMRAHFVKFVNALQRKKECLCYCSDFKCFTDSYFPLSKGTFVYADPPYLISHATYNNVWDEKKDEELMNYLDWINGENVKFALSNVLENKGIKNDKLKNWAEKNGYNIIHLNNSYSNSYHNRKCRDCKTDEVLITNYDI